MQFSERQQNIMILFYLNKCPFNDTYTNKHYQCDNHNNDNDNVVNNNQDNQDIDMMRMIRMKMQISMITIL